MSSLTSSVFTKYPSTETFGGRKVLNLGCGFAQFKAKNVVNLDGEPCSNADIIWDLSKTPLPFEDNTFDFIIANHILEHVPNWWKCFEDCARILKPEGKLEIWVPGQGSDAVLGFRDHINTINNNSFFGIHGLTRNVGNAWAEANHAGPARQLKLVGQMLHLEKKWWLRYSPKAFQYWCAEHLRNVIFQSGFVFEKIAVPQLKPAMNPAILEAMI